MSLTSALGLAFVTLFLILVLASTFLARRRPGRNFREISAFSRLRRSIGLSVEAGNRLHLSLGRGDLVSLQSAIAFAGLSVLDRIARSTSVSDRPPVATAGEGSLAILAQDTLRTTARRMGADFDPAAGRLTGLTPWAYAAGTMAVIHDEEVGANVLIGSFASELALMTEAGERAGSLNLVGTDNLTGQAVLYATAQEPLVGEEAFAGGAYLNAGSMHVGSLRAQDILRWVLIVVLLGGAILQLAGVM